MDEFLRALAGVGDAYARYLLDHGRSYEVPDELLPDIWSHLPRDRAGCFANAARSVLYDLADDLTYVEGYAMGSIPVLHAWLIDSEQRVIDPTWESATAYYGVTFTAAEVAEAALAREVWSDLIGWKLREQRKTTSR